MRTHIKKFNNHNIKSIKYIKSNKRINNFFRNIGPIGLTIMLASCEGAYANQFNIQNNNIDNVDNAVINNYYFPKNLNYFYNHERRNIHRVVDNDRNISPFRIYYQY